MDERGMPGRRTWENSGNPKAGCLGRGQDGCLCAETVQWRKIFFCSAGRKGPQGLEMARTLPAAFDTPVFRDACGIHWIFS
ncbi:MAG: hypothetical protein ACLRXA_23005 [Clostridium sp.]